MRLFGRKSAPHKARPPLSRYGAAAITGDWPRSYEAQVRSGYVENAVAQRAVKLVAESVADAPLAASSPELAALVGARFLEAVASQIMLHGNAYVQILGDGRGGAGELFALRPERVAVEPGADGWPAAYRYKVGDRVTRLSPDGPRPDVIHLKSFNPVDDHLGLGCLGAASGAIAIHNAAAQWNKALLDNAARPSGALVYDPKDGSALAPAQFERLKRELEASFSGERNAGRPMLLEGGLTWQALSLTPADMDFVALKAAAAREIALAFGVPPMLLGLPGDATYANYREANRALWRLAVLPLAGMIFSGLSRGLVAIDGESGRWRVTEAALEAMVTTLTCVRATPPGAMPSASPGRALPAPDRVAGTTILHVAELPVLGDSPLAAPRLSMMANGTGAGWRRASLLYSLDDGASWRDGGETAAPAVIGVLLDAPGAGSVTLVDLANSFEVDLARSDMMLHDADEAALDRGGNLALVGGELIQFGRAEQIGPSRWRLSQLWRGRRGTEGAMGAQAAGDRFVLLAGDAVATIDLPVAAIGSTVRVLASGIGDTAGPIDADCLADGASVRPPSPARLRIEIVAGAPTLTWTRRSRAGFRWIDGGDVPLGEESEAYRVTIMPPAGAPREVATTDRTCPLDSGDVVAGTVLEVRQIGMLAASLPARIGIS